MEKQKKKDTLAPRIIITNVYPEIDCGCYPAKRVTGEPFTISADVFGDGHDEVKASVLYRHQKSRKWQEVSMAFLGNDRWKAVIIPDKCGFYEYTIKGWHDHFSTWQHDLFKKHEAGQGLETDLLIGAEMIGDAAKHAPSSASKKLQEYSKKLSNTKDRKKAYHLAVGEEVSHLMAKWAPKDHAATYHKTLKLKVEREKALFSSWYEFFPRSASPEPGRHGTFKDCERVLPEIARMGFDVVYLPPIHPIGESKRKGKNNSVTASPGDPGSPWAIGSKEGGHKAIPPELGTLEDFHHLIKAASGHGIEVAIDLAYQCAPDHPYVKEHPEWFKWRPDGTVQYAENPPKKYEDVLPINFETKDRENLWQELKSVVEYWIGQGIKIFRVDNPHTKPFPFWEWLISDIYSKHNDIIFLSEAFTRPRVMEQLSKIGFTQTYTYFTWRNTKEEFREYLTELTKTELREYYRPNFWPNTPDILTPNLAHQNEAAFVIRVALAATLSSNYGIYGPVYEFGLNQPHPKKEEYIDNEKYEIKHWDWKKDTRIKDAIIRLNRIRKDNRALQTTWNLEFVKNDNPQLLSYLKWDEEEKNRLLIIVNLDSVNAQSGWINVPLKRLNIPAHGLFEVHDLMNDSRYTWQGEWNYVELDPKKMPVHIFKL